ncbi:MAG: hypothetical protein ACREOM_11370 [Candidatus Dormibacteraceae bacterium]
MGASTHEIDRQIKETRDRMDENLDSLEKRATSSAMRYGKVAAAILCAAALGGAGFLLYRRLRKPQLKDRLRGMSMGSLRDLADEVAARLKKPLPSLTLTVSDPREEEPGVFESIVRRVAPAVVGTASTALMERVSRPALSARERASGTAPTFD